MITLWIVLGLALGGASILPARWMSPRQAWMGVLLAVVAMNAIYIGVALPGPTDVLLAETAVAMGVSTVAWLLHERRSRWLTACVLVHAVIDLGHLVLPGAPVPEWYVWVCLGYDVAFAAGALRWAVVSRAPHTSLQSRTR